MSNPVKNCFLIETFLYENKRGSPSQHHQEHVESSQRWVWSRRTFGASHLQLGSTKQDFAQKKYFRPTGTAAGTTLLWGLLSSIISAFILCMYRTQQNSNFGFLVRFSENWRPWWTNFEFFSNFLFFGAPSVPRGGGREVLGGLIIGQNRNF